MLQYWTTINILCITHLTSNCDQIWQLQCWLIQMIVIDHTTVKLVALGSVNEIRFLSIFCENSAEKLVKFSINSFNFRFDFSLSSNKLSRAI